MNRRRATSIVQIGEVDALKNNRAERFKNNEIKTKQSRVIAHILLNRSNNNNNILKIIIRVIIVAIIIVNFHSAYIVKNLSLEAQHKTTS